MEAHESSTPETTEPVSTPAKDIDLTPKAVEMAKKAIERRGTPTAALRLGVRGGGCSGASYVIEFADRIRDRDHVFEFEGGALKVVVDPKSLVYLRGSVLDYEVKLMSHGFKFQNPNEKKGCGCGESFSI
ncbi:HesB/IscA family protein [Sandaracinus amylolyticus]|uniref:Iron binding protein IscA for iron-sulfur cluster assembly n=1 Tax=Sandaracinus amylolyticus TaxID=927083 RepID=A0A0F6YJT3_9BACT|nr:iron-sulfur cluster assembly accessory protein [Sandaracinus amylolyticus]AKF07560.1 Iron binding protein IscA for iron-sulfur cluster assembly [Sandaracinus amylolyticus]